MINFTPYVDSYCVLVTNSVDDPSEISGIRVGISKVFRFEGKWVLTRPLTTKDLEDEDYVLWLNNMWNHNEETLKSFLAHKKELT